MLVDHGFVFKTTPAFAQSKKEGNAKGCLDKMPNNQ
jgi:hypothetical protein